MAVILGVYPGFVKALILNFGLAPVMKSFAFLAKSGFLWLRLKKNNKADFL